MGIDTGLIAADVQTGGDNIQPVERETGIEPASLAWKARVLPLNYSRLRVTANLPCRLRRYVMGASLKFLVEEVGFEPT
jgi:hypothetical protein